MMPYLLLIFFFIQVQVQVMMLCPKGVYAAQKENISNVILVTLDGVRWQEVFGEADLQLAEDDEDEDDLDPDLFKTKPFINLNTILAPDGILIGDRNSGSEMIVGEFI